MRFDALDLPAYAARLHDQRHEHPEFARLATWRRPERPSRVSRAREVEAIRRAQDQGLVSGRFSAEQVLVLVLAVASMWSDAAADSSDHVVRRQTVQDAVRRLVEP